MFIPLFDDVPLRNIRRPYVTWVLIAVTCLAYAVGGLAGWVAIGDGGDRDALAMVFGLTPAVLDGAAPAPRPELAPLATLLTYPFVHADLLHLAGNMLFLRAFGDNVEDAFGHGRFALFYAVAAVVAGLAHALVHPLSPAPLIGASGAVAGVVAAYVTLHPRVWLWVLAFGRVPLRVPAWLAIGLWILFQLYNVWVQRDDDVAWFAHIGGLAAGFALVLVLRLPGVPLFDRAARDR